MAKSRKPRAGRSYKGALRDPIVVKPVPQQWNRLIAPVPNADDLAEHNARLIGANPHMMMDLVSKMLELLELYQVSPFASDKWFRLAVALATEHVPGFEITSTPSELKKSGRRPLWDRNRLLRLVGAVEKLKAESRRRTIPQCCAILAKSTEWDGLTPRNLEARYHDGKKLR